MEVRLSNSRAENGQIVYEWKEGSGTWGKQEARDSALSLSQGQMELLKKELQRTGVELKEVQDRYQIREPNQMSGEVYKKVMAALARTKSAEAA